MRSKPFTASDTATRNRPRRIAEFYFGGAGDGYYSLVRSYVAERRLAVPDRQISYNSHWQAASARRAAADAAASGARIVLVGHSWGTDAMLAAMRGAPFEALLIAVDPVAKPGTRLGPRDRRPERADLIVHVDARTSRYERSDYVKAVGHAMGGGVPRAYREADVRITADRHHREFHAMMRAPGTDGRSAEDWLAEA